MAVRLRHEPGEFIGPGQQYEVLEKIATGGMATVYLVRDHQENRELAAKECDLLDDPRGKGLSRDEAIAIFLREGTMLADLAVAGIPRGFLLSQRVDPARYCTQCGNQVPDDLARCALCRPGVGSLYENPQEVAERHYLLMDHVPGRDMDQLAAEMARPLGKMDLARVRAWTVATAEILDYLHGRDLVHRDIKGSNIRIRRGDGMLFLLDHGLLTRAWDPRGTRTLKADGNMGPEGYAPPEQAEGRSVPAGDIYALAKTFMSMLTGLDPGNPLENRELETLAPDVLVPGLAPELCGLVRRSFDRDPARRPVARDWISVLRANAGLVVAGTRSNSSREPDRVEAARFPVGYAALAAVLVLVVAWFFLFRGGEREAYLVEARRDAVIYRDTNATSVGRRLNGGERLMVESLGRDNWLRVHSVDEVREKGYIRRNRVDTPGEGK